ncbi:MAG: hypothetical protein QGI09_08740 [Dehalococcoidia bacterium]|nr:hypothetical protein [Dehalococcoidia bacterium]
MVPISLDGDQPQQDHADKEQRRPSAGPYAERPAMARLLRWPADQQGSLAVEETICSKGIGDIFGIDVNVAPLLLGVSELQLRNSLTRKKPKKSSLHRQALQLHL